MVDAGYINATLLVSSPQEHQIDLVGPVRTDVSWQARAGQGYDSSAFRVDWEAQTATCPAGHTSVTWHSGHDRWGNAVIHVAFHQRYCRPCPHRPLCTRAKREPRELTLKPPAEHEALPAARARRRWPGRPSMPYGRALTAPFLRGFGGSPCVSHAM
jgi:transposase